MREILFRGKRIDNGQFFEGYLLKMFGEISIMEKCCENTIYPIEEDTVGQYIDLLDKNGVKIFEGDIISASDGEIGIIKWFGYEFGFVIDSATSIICIYNYCSEDLKVIGNIHDNPELLEVNNANKL